MRSHDIKPLQAAAAVWLGLALWMGPAKLPAAPATWPNLLNYQGQLTDAAGTSAVADASYSIFFSIYAGPSGGSSLWSETQTATTRKGLFHVVLGTVNSLASLNAAALSNDLWLGLTVGTDAEMTPRQQLLPAVYALNSEMLAGLLPNNAANNLVVLDSAGKIPSGLVQTGSLAAPLDLSGAGAGYTLNVSNTSAAAGALGIYASGSNAVLAQALNADGYGVWGQTLAADNADAVGLHGSATNGIGLLAQSTNGVGLSVTSQSTTAFSLFSGGNFPSKFVVGSGVTANAAVIATTQGGSNQASLVDRGDAAAVWAKTTASAVFAVSGTANSGTAIFGQSNSSSLTDYGVWGNNSGANGIAINGIGSGANGIGVNAVGGSLGLQASGANAGVSGTSSAGVGVVGNGPTGMLGQATTSSGTGVEGFVDASLGAASTAVFGVNNSASGTAVWGRHQGSGPGTGVRGGSPSGVGAFGVYGTVSGTGGSVGVEGFVSANDGYGVVGIQSNATPVSYVAGVLGKANSLFNNGIGVRGEGNQGVYGLSTSQCGVCAYNTNPVASYPAAGLYANSPFDAILAESTNTSAAGYGVFATTQSVFGGSAAGYFGAQGASGVTDGVIALNASAGGRAVHAVSSGGINYYSDTTNQPAFGFSHQDNNPVANGVGVYSVESCASCYGGDFINTVAQSGAGAALNVQGRLRLVGSAGTFGASLGSSTFTLNNPYILSTSLIFLTTQTAQSSVAAVTSVGTGTATITFTPALTVGTNYQYLIVGQ